MDRALSARVAKQAWFHRYPRGWPMLIFVLTLMVTALSVIAIERADRQRTQYELDRNLTEIASGLQRRAAENFAILAAGAALFEARGQVGAKDFTDFASGFYGKGNYHGSLGMGWAQALDPRIVPDFELAMRAAVDPGYGVYPRPALDQEISTPIVYLDPDTAANRQAIGFDMYSEDVRRAAMKRAWTLRKPVTSGRVRLVQDRDDPGEVGFLIYMPVFEDIAGKRRIKGFVYSPFRATEFLDAAAQLYGDRDVEVELFDEVAGPDNLLAWRSVEGASDLTMDRELHVGERTWVLRVSAKREAVLSQLSRVVLLSGTVMALLMLYLARMVIRRAADDRAMLEMLTSQWAIRDSLTRELNHRVKNTLANVLSIVALTRRRATGIEDFAESLGGRIRALSATHDLLSRSDWRNAPLGEVVRSELAPYMGDGDDHVAVAGPDIDLAPNDAMSLGLAIHELATNAAKYGALSAAGGKVSVDWGMVTPALAEVRWRETGGPPVQEPSTRGFGRDLIEKIVAHELRADVDLRFRPEGVECVLRVPVRKLGEFSLRKGAPGAVDGRL